MSVTDPEPLNPAQVRAARALLAWSQQDLARQAHVAASTVADFERGQRTPVANNADAMRGALEAAGIAFLPGGALIGPPPTKPRAAPQVGNPVRWVDATDLAQWAERRAGQGSMPELLARLIRAAIGSVAQITFPSDESVQFPGWDGTCEIPAGTAQIPDGSSGWEIGTQRTKLAEKADDDYAKRTADPLGRNRRETTFIFVTPRRWTKKLQWAAAKRAEKKWRDVRAYDADDLVHWIELYPAVGQWLAAAIGKRPSGVQQLDEAWEEWSLSTQQPLTSELILSGRDEDAARVLRWLRNEPAVLAVQAEAPDEAVAFLHAAIGQLPDPYRAEYHARTLITHTADTARALGDSVSPLILVLEDPDPGVARRLAERGHHVFVAQGASEVADQMLRLGRPPREAIEQALMNMGFEREQAHNLARDAARSLAVLRRLMPSAPARVPFWAKENLSRCVVAALLAGAWSEDSDGDKAALERLAGEKYETIVAELAPLVGYLERPLRKAGSVWKVASPRDAWFRLASRISPADFVRFEAVAHNVLASRDPRFEMTPDERWLAGLKGIHPEYSGYLRRGLGETLILFSLYPSHVPSVTGAAIGVENLVRKLLQDADEQRWWSLTGEFQLLAEAAPGTFLTMLDDALGHGDQVDVLFKEDQGLSGGTYLAELLWALESLAWSPQYLGRVASILARLTARDPGGRYENRPGNSLRSIFLMWFPQTYAPLTARLRVLDQVRKQEPDVGWNLMRRILPSGHDMASPASHTRWRDLTTDHQEQVTYPLLAKGGEEIAKRLLADVGDRADRWVSLIGAFPNLLREHRRAALEQLTAAAPAIAGDDDRVLISGAMRSLLSHHRGFPDAEWALPEAELEPIEAVYNLLQPRDLLKRSIWLFGSGVRLLLPAVQIVAGEHVNHSWQDDEREAARLRRVAVQEILEARGTGGVLLLTQSVELPELVGRALVELSEWEPERDSILAQALMGANKSDEALAHGMVVGGLIKGGDEWVDVVLTRAKREAWGDDATFRILRALPETQATWDRALAAGEQVDGLYWARRNVIWIDPTQGNLVYAIERLLKAERAKDAIHLIGHHRREALPIDLIIRVLKRAVQETWTDADQNAVTMFRHHVIDIFKVLDVAKEEVSDPQIATLEWAYLPLFQFSDRPPRMLQKALATEPAFFVEVLKKVYRPSDESGIEEPPPNDTERERAIATQAYDLLHSWHRLPGTSDDGVLESTALEAWVKEARIQAAAVGRGAIADHQIGQVLAHAGRDTEGIWPAVPIRDVIEITRSSDLERGLYVGVRNGRGVTSRGMNDGGAQERDLARYYHHCAEETALEWPRTSAVLELIAKSYEHEGVEHDEDAERRDWR